MKTKIMSFLISIILGISIFLIGCTKCEEKTVQCKAVPAKYQVFFKENTVNDQLTFVNNKSESIDFIVENTEIIPCTVLDCFGPNGLGGCSCPTCMNHSYAELTASSNSDLYKSDPGQYPYKEYYTNYSFQLKLDDYERLVMSLDFINITCRTFIDERFFDSNLTFYSQINLDGKEFTDVYQINLDSLAPNNNYPRQYFNAVYLSKEKGLVAFHDKLRNSLFRLEE